MHRKPLSHLSCLVLCILLLTDCQSASLPATPTVMAPLTTNTAVPPTSTATPLPPTATITPTSTNTLTPTPIPTKTFTPTPTPVTPVGGVIYESETVNGVTFWFAVDDTGTQINAFYVKNTGISFPYYVIGDLSVPIQDGKFEYNQPGSNKFIVQGQFETPTTASGKLTMETNLMPLFDMAFIAKAPEAKKSSATPAR